MSLINEALKRTRDASFQAGHARPVNVDTYRVSSREDAASLGPRTGVWVSFLVVVMASVAVLVFALRVARPSNHVREALSLDSESSVVAAPPVTVAPRPVEPVTVPATTLPVNRKTSQDELVDKVVEKLRAEQPPASKEVPAPEPTKFVLQGITSAATWREAMINGYAVREGDEVDGARVLSIESRRVKLQQGDREIVLRMP